MPVGSLRLCLMRCAALWQARQIHSIYSLRTKASAARSEKGLHRARAFFPEHAAENLHAMIERRMAEDLEAGMHGAAFGIVAAIDKTSDASLNHGSSTHRAGLNRDVERGAVQAVISEGFGCGAQGDDFRMSARIAIGDGAIPRSRQEPVAKHDGAANGYFAAFRRGPRFGERQPHIFEIIY